MSWLSQALRKTGMNKPGRFLQNAAGTIGDVGKFAAPLLAATGVGAPLAAGIGLASGIAGELNDDDGFQPLRGLRNGALSAGAAYAAPHVVGNIGKALAGGGQAGSAAGGAAAGQPASLSGNLMTNLRAGASAAPRSMGGNLMANMSQSLPSAAFANAPNAAAPSIGTAIVNGAKGAARGLGSLSTTDKLLLGNSVVQGVGAAMPDPSADAEGEYLRRRMTWEEEDREEERRRRELSSPYVREMIERMMQDIRTPGL